MLLILTYIKALSIVVLGFYVSITSVPRCSTVKTIATWIGLEEQSTAEPSSHCHEEVARQSDTKHSQWQQAGCKCEIFDFSLVILDLFPKYSHIKAPNFEPMYMAWSLLIAPRENSIPPSLPPPIV